MIYQSSSIEPVVAKIIRDTRLKDSTLLPDVLEWIAEAMDQLPSPGLGKKMYVDRTVDFHRASLPCGLIYIRAVEYNGGRLRQGSAGAVAQEVEVIGNFCPLLKQATDLQFSRHWYDIEPPQSITTSIREGKIRIHYYGRATDKYGFPFVPDNANYKEAVYWYVRSKMIASGWEDKVMRYGDTLQLHEKYAGRAMGEVWYPSIDEMPDKNDLLYRLVPDMNYFERFEMSESAGNISQQSNVTTGIPITSLIVERMAPNPAGAFPFKFTQSTFSRTFLAGEHKLTRIRGVSFLDPDGQVVLVPYSVDGVSLAVTVESNTDLLNHTMTIF